MAIKEPVISEIAYKTWCINEKGMDAMFLLEGDNSALLIDTGTGTFDLNATVKSLTDKPFMVALTHGHVDHSGGMNQFEKVYLHPDDFEMARAVSVEERKSYLSAMTNFNGGVFELNADDVKDYTEKAELLQLKEGDVIHLGGRDIKVYETPGHTPGGLSYLDVKERIMISGDACNGNTLLAMNCRDGICTPKTNISDLLYTARKLDSLSAEYDRHYNGHIGYGGYIGFMSQPRSLVKDCIELCEGLLDGTIKGEENNANAFTGPALLAKYKTLQVLYKKEQLK